MPASLRWAERLLPYTLLVGLLHHADHVLRADHSGWPFIDRITPFTYSLVAYPILLFALLARRLPVWLRALPVALMAGFTLFAHSGIETPKDQFWMWAYNCSLDPRAPDARNLLGIASPALGVAAAGISLLLNLLLVAVSALLLDAALRPRDRGQPPGQRPSVTSASTT